ncbi:tripartite tricarboxylate transporter substrate binding protein [Verticiella sediminum]|uniref:Tripartite tricarboxylate transporter substrate binding protein n=2 Tax=Verticiella sediminum TaxID=1247510 RepID=A0A556AVN5_9BURK|nr:tripartite tricarboxylate transporter substrate binding protein [Verticiella sediminum]
MTATVALALATIGAASDPARAQAEYPRQPIRLVVPAPAGGGTDHMARVIGNAIAANTRWTVVVENKPGASGIIGMEAAAKAKPDGYTIGIGQTATVAINPELFRTLPYDVLHDFVPIATLAEQPVVLVVRADASYSDLADLVKAHQAKHLTLASAGAGTVGQLVGEMLGTVVGAKFVTVPYRGTAPALQDVVGGITDAMFATPPGALPLLQGGRLRALAVTSAQRLPLLPDVPTLAELGYPGIEVSEWKVLMAPRGTPAAVIERLHREVQVALAQDEVIERVVADGNLPLTGSTAAAEAFVRKELARWSGIVREAGLSKTN